MLAEICKEVALPLVEDSMQYSDRVCNPCGRKIRKWASCTSSLNLQLHPRQVPVKSSIRTVDTPDKASPAWTNTKSVPVNSPQRGHPRSKVPGRL